MVYLKARLISFFLHCNNTGRNVLPSHAMIGYFIACNGSTKSRFRSRTVASLMVCGLLPVNEEIPSSNPTWASFSVKCLRSKEIYHHQKKRA